MLFCGHPTMPHADADFVRDTDPRAMEVFLALQRNRSLSDKLQDVFDLSDGLLELTKAGMRLRHPEASEREMFLRALATRLSRDLMIKVYGRDPAAASAQAKSVARG